MNNPDDNSTHLSVDRARAIVAHAEDEFASGVSIGDAFTPFAEGGASTRLEALQALYIIIADTYRLVSVRRSGSPGEMREFERYASHSGFIAMRIATDKIKDPANLADPNCLLAQESVESFVGYCRTLNPASEDFWPKVYRRIGLVYPAECDRTPDTTPVGRRPWWRFW